MIKVQLTSEQQKEIEDFRRQASSKDSEKALMVLMSADDKSVGEISSTLKRNPHTVRDWLKRYQQKGLKGLSRKFSPGRPDEKRTLIKKRIKEILNRPPKDFGYMDSVWAVPLIAHDLNSKFDISVSKDTVVRALKDMGYSYKRPSKTPPVNAPSRKEKIEAIEKMIEEINKTINNKDSVVYALDESHFSTEPYLVQGWFLKRWPPQDTHQQQKRKSHILWLLEHKNTKILLEKVSQGK
jgi:transposase